MSEFEDWVRSRPPSVQALMRDWPPLCAVRTKPGVTLAIPAPGIEGKVVSYYENGTLGVTAPMRFTGVVMQAMNVRPDQLELVREDPWTKADVERALA